ITMGSVGETCMTAIDAMRSEGASVGQVRIRLWRPFPREDFLAAIAGAKNLVVIDRALSPGATDSPVAAELKSLLYTRGVQKYVSGFVAGLGGRDVTRQDFKDMYALAVADFASGAPMGSRMVGVCE
ncbi:MAG: pyruvate ferredoxin oxidoreductase, partial [Desulfovibrio sp.]|nr:pyruvate ferredoxin oxidoreductase [Desulfovibrio sp.]